MNPQLKILLVEDDALIGADLKRTLSSFGYAVIGPISSGEEVVEQIVSLNPNFVLMDIQLKGKLDGIQTVEAIQKKVALPVVFLTGLTDEASFQRAKLVNPYGYLIKPFDEWELRATIELTLQRFSMRSGETPDDDTSDSDGRSSPLVFSGTAVDFADEKTSIVAHLKQIPLFQELEDQRLEGLAANCSIRQFEAGEFISLEGADSKGGFIPLSGRIAITKTADSGKELIVSLLAPGDVLGLQFALSSFATALSAKTQVAARVIWIAAPKWESFREQNPKLDCRLCSMVSGQLIAAYTLASGLAHASVERRIVSAILALLPHFGKTSGQVPNTGRIYITRKELAELTGTTPETAYRVTKNLEREHFLDLTRPGILKISDINSLRKAAARE